MLELLAGELRVLGEVEVAPIGEFLELDHPIGKRYSMSEVAVE